MKDRYLFLAVNILLSVLFISSSAFSQATAEHSISLYGGISFPVNEFVSTSGSDVGYAKTGYSLSLSHNIMVYEPIRLLTTVTLSVNQLDENALQHYMIGRIAPIIGSGEQLQGQIAGIFEKNTKVLESGSYSSVFLLTGPQVRTEIFPDIYVNGSVQVGLLVQSNPKYQLVYTGLALSGQGFLYQPEATRTAFAYGLSGGVEVGKFSLNAKFVYGQPKYDISRSYLLPVRIVTESNIVDVPESATTGNFTLAKEPTSMIIVQLGYTLL